MAGPWLRRLGAGLLLCSLAAAAAELPPEVTLALQRAKVPLEAVSVVVQESGSGRVRVDHRGGVPVNPASLTKLVTTIAALDQLGPAWTWRTPVWVQGPLRDGVLDGSVHVQGRGDPTLVLERVWLLLRRLQQMGVREIRGDVVLDSSAFANAGGSAADFDGEAGRAYNVRAEALLLNYKSVVYGFVPDAARGVATVTVEPPLSGHDADRSVPLAQGPCGDWRARLDASFTGERARFAGSYPASCGELSWVRADPDPDSYNARLIQALWREMGGRLTGSVREGPAPAGRPTFELQSPPLLEVVREINKFSNNVMAQQLFLTLALERQPGRAASPAAAREWLQRWLVARFGDLGSDGVVIDNGSGLSRETRMPARLLARLLTHAADGPWMAELMSSLPIAGVDGTLRRTRTGVGRAHLKTGSLRDVVALAGWVLADNGQRWQLVAVVQHPQAQAARPALEALVQWVQQDAPARSQGPRP